MRVAGCALLLAVVLQAMVFHATGICAVGLQPEGAVVTVQGQRQEQGQGQSPRHSIRVLHIGNSFSNNAVRYLPNLARAGGKELTVFGATLGGSTLERHAGHLGEALAGDPRGSVYVARPSLALGDPQQTRVSLPEALRAQKWDVVTIQQASTASYKPETYEPFAKKLIAEIRRRAPQAQILVHQTWAYRPDHPLFRREADLDADKMHAGITAAYRELGARYGLKFLPTGNAIHATGRTPLWRPRKDPDYNYARPEEGREPDERGLHVPHRWQISARTGKSTVR